MVVKTIRFKLDRELRKIIEDCVRSAVNILQELGKIRWETNGFPSPLKEILNLQIESHLEFAKKILTILIPLLKLYELAPEPIFQSVVVI